MERAVYYGNMPALDRYHRAVASALRKDGWTITDDPLTLELEERTFYVDFGVERLLAAEKGAERIAVEVKTFGSPSPIADLEQARGQFSLYEEVLRETQPDRMLYLAIPEAAFHGVFHERIGQIILQNRIRRAFCFSPEREEIMQWIPAV